MLDTVLRNFPFQIDIGNSFFVFSILFLLVKVGFLDKLCFAESQEERSSRKRGRNISEKWGKLIKTEGKLLCN